MKKTALATAFGLILALCLYVAPVRAASVETFVSSGGSDGNDCHSETTACRSFATAISNTTNGGTVICLSSGDFGGVSIFKSITIDCRGHVARVSDLSINMPNVVVILRGLHIYGHYDAATPGIEFLDGNALHVEDCRIAAFGGAGASPFVGVHFAPSAASRLYVTDSVISENGAADNSSGGGIFVQPTGSGSARVVLNRVTVTQNTLGIVVDGSASSGRSVVEINDSMVGGSIRNGISVNQAGMVINRTAVQSSGGNGILAGPGALVHLRASTVAANALGGLAYNGGQIFSYGDNATKGNGVDNAPSGALTLN